MRRALSCLPLALVWVGLTGILTVPNAAVGLALGLIALWPVTGRAAAPSRRMDPGTPRGRTAKRSSSLARPFVVLYRIPGFLLFFLYELGLSNLRVAREVVAPRPRFQPGILAVPLAAETDLEVTLLCILVTLTPGTLSLDVSDDRRTLYVHVAHLEDPDRTRLEIQNGFERRILELTR